MQLIHQHHHHRCTERTTCPSWLRLRLQPLTSIYKENRPSSNPHSGPRDVQPRELQCLLSSIVTGISISEAYCVPWQCASCDKWIRLCPNSSCCSQANSESKLACCTKTWKTLGKGNNSISTTLFNIAHTHTLFQWVSIPERITSWLGSK